MAGSTEFERCWSNSGAHGCWHHVQEHGCNRVHSYDVYVHFERDISNEMGAEEEVDEKEDKRRTVGGR